MSHPHLHSAEAPHSTVERLSRHLVVRAMAGAASGAVLFLGISHSLQLTFGFKIAAAVFFIGVCAVGGAFSSACRCSVLLMFPSMLGSRGRAYIMLLILSVLCRGPVSNIHNNVASASLSLSCNLDLQVHHSKLLWRDAVKPFITITQELKADEAEFQSESVGVSRRFQSIRDEVMLQYGYDQFKPKHPVAPGKSTQDQYTTKTRMQCDSVVDEGIQRCSDWFVLRWTECMEAIPVPVLNHILCVSMTFDFLCDVMKVMTPWCREQIPVEGNFGQLFDQLNGSVDLLSREFTTELVLEEHQQQSLLGGEIMDQQFTQEVTESFTKLTAAMTRLLNGLQLLLSFTFITIFTQAFVYLRQYRTDIRFDNVYITGYFRELDNARRRKGKRGLLPLKQSEKSLFIDPWSPKILPEEIQQVSSGVLQLLSVSLLCLVLLAVDFSVFHVLDIVSRHTVTQFNLTSSHQVDIRVGGASMMARLLRKTVSAFNSSNSVSLNADNRVCVSAPSPLPHSVYISCVCCVLLVALFSCLQVYTNRLRRVITAFFHPEREKQRVSFLYNLQIQRRISGSRRKRIINQRRRTVFQALNRCGRGLCLCHKQQESP